MTLSSDAASAPPDILAAIVAAASAHIAATSAVPQKIAAVIAAATHVALAGASHRIVSVTPVGMRGHAFFPYGNEWALEGRRAIFASHNPR